VCRNYLKEVSLFNQPFVKNDKQTVEQMLKEKNTTIKALRCMSWARASRKKQMTLQLKWLHKSLLLRRADIFRNRFCYFPILHAGMPPCTD
jgi:hypothetical protein